MKNQLTCIIIIVMMTIFDAYSQNPLITNIFTADPAAHQFSDGKLYLYADHDPAGENGGWLNMFNYHVYSTSDMKIWTDHGSLFDCKTITWNDGAAWDGDCVEANGKYYYYFPMVDKIGVMVADSPTGPFKDALGKPLITRDTPGVKKKATGWLTSPCVLFYKDTAYMYLGQNDEFYLVKLKKNMLELDGPVITLKQPENFHEAAWVNFANGKFHATFGGRAKKGQDKLANAVADNPYGPFVFQYFIQKEKAASVQNCITEFNGKNYIFYHQNGPDDYHRQICAEEFKYTKKGLIPKIPRTKKGLGLTEIHLDARGKMEAEDYQNASNFGIDRQLEPTGEGNWYVSVFCPGQWIQFQKVDFGAGVKSFELAASSGVNVIGGKIELRLDKPDGLLIGECAVNSTENWFQWKKFTCSINAEAKGVHDLYLVMRGDSKTAFYYQVNYMLDYFTFK